MALKDFTQWSNAQPYLGEMPSWLNGDEATRVASYQKYEEIYWNVPETFKVVQRGSEDSPIYIPSARKIIEATNRFYGVGFDYTISGGSESDRDAVSLAMRTLFRRERFFSKYNSMKRFGLVRGDSLWHIIADENKPETRRISIHELSPANYFPIYDPDDIDTITGVHIAGIIKDDKGVDIVRRQTYRKVLDNNGTPTGRITSELATFEVSNWDDRNLQQEAKEPELKMIEQLVPPFELPEQITSIPVYHIRNQYQGGYLYGSSEIRGIERVIAAINQGISDEELTLALDGLGVYTSTAPEPDGGWVLGPGSVVELDGELKRVNGVGTVRPSQDHLGYLDRSLKEASGTPDIAVGRVDVSIAESGIALQFQMSPILAKNVEKETELLAVHDHMFFDLTRGWLAAFEGLTAGGQITIEPRVGDPMPVDRKAVLAEVVQLVDARLVSPEYARTILTEKLGYEFPDEMDGDILTSIRAVSEATWADPMDERIRKELTEDVVEQNGSGT